MFEEIESKNLFFALDGLKAIVEHKLIARQQR
jgi:hypothetical protein